MGPTQYPNKGQQQQHSTVFTGHAVENSSAQRPYPTVRCVNVNGDEFPCEGGPGGCCGNACYAPGSKCCRSPYVPRSRWYPVAEGTRCAFGEGEYPTPYPTPYPKGQVTSY